MKNILVVGGAGYIGSYMCKYLAKKGLPFHHRDVHRRILLASHDAAFP